MRTTKLIGLVMMVWCLWAGQAFGQYRLNPATTNQFGRGTNGQVLVTLPNGGIGFASVTLLLSNSVVQQIIASNAAAIAEARMASNYARGIVLTGTVPGFAVVSDGTKLLSTPARELDLNYIAGLTGIVEDRLAALETSGGGGGTVDYLGNAGATNNVVKFGLVSIRNGTTNFLKTLEAGSNISIVDQGGTNLIVSSTATGTIGGDSTNSSLTITGATPGVIRLQGTNGNFITLNAAQQTLVYTNTTNVVIDMSAGHSFFLAASGNINFLPTNTMPGQIVNVHVLPSGAGNWWMATNSLVRWGSNVVATTSASGVRDVVTLMTGAYGTNVQGALTKGF